MSKIIISLTVLCLLFGTAFPQSGLETKGSFLCHQGKLLRDWVPAGDQAFSGPVHSFDVQKYILDIDLTSCFSGSYPNSFHGNVRIVLKADSVINFITLHAESYSLIIDSVKLAGTAFIHSDDLLTITLNRAYVPGEQAEVMVYYRHKDVQDNAFFASNGMVFTDCQPEGARRWFPCWDKPSDKALWELTARVPSGVRLGSNGRLADSTINGNILTYHWISEHPIATYLMVISARTGYLLDIVYWHVPGSNSDSIPIRFYYNPGESPQAIESMILPMTDWFSQNFCLYPFEKNGFATLNNEFTWGGMENQTLTSLCPGCWYESLIAHEFAHQWFGDMITCATWADIWLNEGFATWSEAFWFESYAGYAAYKADIDGNANYYLSANPGWPIANPEWAVVTPPKHILFNYAITYTKAACVLHLLRYTLGDSLFFEVLQSYSTNPELRYQSAVIPDFIEVVNEATGEDYSWFFDQWLYAADHPVYQNTFMFTNLGSGIWQVDFNARQIQSDTVYFRMPLEIMISFEDGSDTLLRIMNTYNNQLFKWQFGKKPVTLKFDPSNQIVLKEGYTIVSTDEEPRPDPSLVFKISPNPAATSFTAYFRLQRESIVQLRLINTVSAEDQIIFQGNLSPGDHRISHPCSDLIPGIYFCRISTGEENVVQKLIVHP